MSLPTEIVVCGLCGLTFEGVVRRKRKFCSRKCAWSNALNVSHKKLQEPEVAEEMRAKRKLFMAGRKPSLKMLQAKAKWQREHSSLMSERCSNTHKGVRETGERSKRGSNHHQGRRGIFRSPAGVQYEFRNVTQFVRDHEAMFAPEDLAWKKDGTICNAAQGLLSLLSFGGKRVRGVWKGWTLVSVFERRFNDGDDLLARNVLQVEGKI